MLKVTLYYSTRPSQYYQLHNVAVIKQTDPEPITDLTFLN